MATKLKVTYIDEREVTVLATPRAQVETERYLRGLGDGNRVEAGYHLAWASLHYAGKEAEDFDTWLDSIADVDEVPLDRADENATDPTPPAPEPTGLSS